MKIFLIRHGESMQNTRENDILKLPDHKVYLTDKGRQEADEVGRFLKKYVDDNKIDTSNATLWVSPYDRTRETASIINKYLNINDIKEDITLIEQRYGLFSDTPLDECKKKYPEQFELYDRYYQNDGKFYAKMPQGESPFDVALRVKQFIDTLYRDVKEGKDTFFVVTHGTTIRAFILDWFHHSPEWFNKEPNLLNCSVRLIEKDNGISTEKYIYGGPKIKKDK
jgi:2,3-bisphosphoglycerate-dependent phosphoglycerate mutase